MLVFHIITHFDVGGAERVAVNIAKSSIQNIEYHLVEVVRGSGEFSSLFVNDLKKNGIIYHRSYLKNNKLGIIFFPFWFILLVLKWKPNVIHSHTEIPDLALYIWHCIFGWLFPKIRYVRTIHNTELWNKWKSVGTKVERFFKKKHANVSISKSTQQYYQKEYGEKPTIIYNGLQEVNQIPFQYLIKGKINILFAGRLEYQKGIDELIKVVLALKNNLNFHFHIIGDGSMKEKLHAELKGLSSVSLYEKVYGLNQYIGSFDYLFMPSNHEGLALIPIEASLAHTPSIINSCPGLKDTLPEDWPLKVEKNCIDDFIKIILALENTCNYQTYSNLAYSYAKENFSIHKMQLEYENIYFESQNIK